MGIIDYEPLNKAIMSVENMIAEHNNEERMMIIEHVRARILKERQSQRESEVMERAVEKLPMGNLLKKLTRGKGDDDNVV